MRCLPLLDLLNREQSARSGQGVPPIGIQTMCIGADSTIRFSFAGKQPFGLTRGVGPGSVRS